jgi:hypothetical protein
MFTFTDTRQATDKMKSDIISNFAEAGVLIEEMFDFPD